MPEYYLAIDIGASSGRHILGSLQDGQLHLEEVYRFDNVQVRKNGHDCWDTQCLWDGILQGLRRCKERGMIPKTVGIDTWGVDFVLLDENGAEIGDAVAYRDERTAGMDRVVDEMIPDHLLYERTGIQRALFNTIYQLAALQREHPEQIEKAHRLLTTPDYYHYKLTGVLSNEYTMATTSNLVNAREKQWDFEVIDRLGLPRKIFMPLSMPGTVLGEFLPGIAEQVGFSATVVLPATHDTGSAFLAIPAKDENAVYLSSGTWSLLGVEISEPITTQESLARNFTNEGGAWGRYRYLKNIMGLWVIQSIRRELNGVAYIRGKQQRSAAVKQWSFADLIAAAKKAEAFESVVDVNRGEFLAPESMIETVREECRRTGQAVPETVEELMQCVYRSLSVCYRDAIRGLEEITGKTFTSINIVGGGCQDMYLNACTARMTGLPVYAGPVEGSAIGNIIVQMCSDGTIPDLQAARDIVRSSFSIEKVSV